MQATGPVVEQPLEYFQQVMDTNLTGAVRMTQAVVPAMLARVSLILYYALYTFKIRPSTSHAVLPASLYNT